MAFIVKIGGIDHSPLVDSVEISTALNQQATCAMQFIDQAGWRPAVGESVEVWDGVALIYSGSVDEASIEEIGTDNWMLVIRNIDQTAVLGRRLAPERQWTNQSAGTIARELGAAVLLGEDVQADTYIETGPTIESFATNYETGAEAFATLGAAAGMVARITPDGELRFHSPVAYPAPYNITSVPNVALVRNLVIRSTREQYANRVVVRLGQSVESGKSDTFDATGRHGDSDDAEMALNGGRKSFDCSHRIYEAPVITINDVQQEVGIQGQDVAAFYWTQGSQRLEMDVGAPAPLATDVMVVTYTAIKENLIARANDGEIAARAAVEEGSGIYEIQRTISEPISLAEAEQYADGLLARYSAISYVATYETDTIINPQSAGLEVGQYQQIARSGYAADGNYLIRSVVIRSLRANGENHLAFTVEAVKGPVVGDAYEFFRRLAGQKDYGAIGIPPSDVAGTPLADITDLDVEGYAGKWADLKIVIAGTLPPGVTFGRVHLWQPADDDPHPEAPNVAYGDLVDKGKHLVPSGGWRAVLRVPYPDVTLVRWIAYITSGNDSQENALVPLSSLDPVLPAGHSPYVVIDLDLMDLPWEEGQAEPPTLFESLVGIGIDEDAEIATISMPYLAPYAGSAELGYVKGHLDGVEVVTMLEDGTDVRSHGRQPYLGGVGPTGDPGYAVATIPLPETRPAFVFIDLLSYIPEHAVTFERGVITAGVREGVTYPSWAKVEIPAGSGSAVPKPAFTTAIVYSQVTPGSKEWRYKFQFTLSGAALTDPAYGGTKFYVEWASGSPRLEVAEHKAGASAVVESGLYDFTAPHFDTATIKPLAYRSDNQAIQTALDQQMEVVGKDWVDVLPAIEAASMSVTVLQYGYKDAQKWYEAEADYTAPTGATIANLYICVKAAGYDPGFIPASSDWKFRGTNRVPGSIGWWDIQPEAGARVFYAIVPKTEHWDAWPRSGVDPVKYFDLPAWGEPPTPTGCSVTGSWTGAATDLVYLDGILHFWFHVNFTDLTGNPDYHEMRITRVPLDPSMNPYPGFQYGADGEFRNRIQFVSGPHKVPNLVERWRFRFIATSWDGRESSPVYADVVFPTSSGIDSAGLDPNKVGAGIVVTAGGVASTDRTLKNGDFELSGKDWTISAGVSFTTTDAFKGTAARLEGNGSGPSLYQTFSVMAGQVVRLESFARENGNSVSELFLRWYNTSGSLIGENRVPISGDSYAYYAVVGAAPLNAASVSVGAICPAANTSGRLLVDQCRLLFLEPAKGALMRNSSGIDLTLDSSSLVVSDGELTTVAAGILDKLGIDPSQFTKVSGFLAINAIAVNYLAAGMAVFTGDVVLSRSGGGSMTLNATGVQIVGGGGTLWIAAGGAEIPMLATGSYASPSIASNTSGNVFYKTASFASGCAVNFNSGSTISIDSSIRAAWRGQLGLGTIATENKGATGTFVSQDGKTVSVVGGIVTSIV